MDNQWTPRLVETVEELAGSSVSEAEAAAVYSWCFDFAADCDWVDFDADALRGFEPASLVRMAARHLDGGVAFVLADVRRMEGEAPRFVGEPAGAGAEHEAMRAAVAELGCTCPGDCNCRFAGAPWHRTNYCGCRAHGVTS